MGHSLRQVAAVALGLTALAALACGGSNEKQATATPSAAGSQPSSTPPSTPQAEASKPADSAAQAPSPEANAPDDAAVAEMMNPWTGDLDGMARRRYIRMLVTFSKTNYFLDGPV